MAYACLCCFSASRKRLGNTDLTDLSLSCRLTGFKEFWILTPQVLAEVLSRFVEENKRQEDEEKPETVWLQCLKCQAEFCQPATESDSSLSHLDEPRNDSKDMALKIKKSFFSFHEQGPGRIGGPTLPPEHFRERCKHMHLSAHYYNHNHSLWSLPPHCNLNDGWDYTILLILVISMGGIFLSWSLFFSPHLSFQCKIKLIKKKMNQTYHKWVIILLEHDRTWIKCLAKEFHEYRMGAKHWVW